LLLISPCVPMLFMGEEYGERNPFPFFCSFGDPQLIEAVRRGRREEFAALDFQWGDQIPDPQDARTFESAKLVWHWPEGTFPCRIATAVP
jgi:maltooligosyltrehalose trehalohydrolase